MPTSLHYALASAINTFSGNIRLLTVASMIHINSA